MNYKESYAKYLNSNHWKQLRIKVFKIYGRKCFYHKNRVKGIHVHHMKYREYLSDCTERDCIPLCEDCHKQAHSSDNELRKVKIDAGKFWESLKEKGEKFKRINKPKKLYAKCKKAKCEVQERRNKFKATNRAIGTEDDQRKRARKKRQQKGLIKTFKV